MNHIVFNVNLKEYFKHFYGIIHAIILARMDMLEVIKITCVFVLLKDILKILLIFVKHVHHNVSHVLGILDYSALIVQMVLCW
jgi:hypothetical protein